MVSAQAGRVKRDAGDTLDFRAGVDVRRDTLVGGIVRRFAEIDTARQLPDDEHIGPLRDLVFKGREPLEPPEHPHRTQVAVDAQMLANTQNARFDAFFSGHTVPRMIADRPPGRAHQYGVTFGANLFSRFGERRTAFVECAAAEGQAGVHELKPVARRHGVQELKRRVNDLRTDKVSG